MRLQCFALSLAGALLAHAQPAKITLEDLLTIDAAAAGAGSHAYAQWQILHLHTQ